MATSSFHFFLLCLLLFSVSSTLSASSELPESGFITLPLKKDPATRQYYASIGIGTPRHNMNLAIDVSENFLWYDCDSHYNSSSYHPVSCKSPKCPENSPCIGCNGFPRKPGCTNNTCGLSISNPFADTIFSGDMGEDLLYLPEVKKPRAFVSGCADSDRFTSPLLTGLAKGTKGILGLSKSSLTLPIQISSAYNIIPKFALCLPSSKKKDTSKIFIGGGPYDFISTRVSLSSSNDEYFINVESIKIAGKVVNFPTSVLSNGGTKISTMIPYTVLHNSIFKPFVSTFVEQAKARNIKRVESVPPFEACFDAKTIGHNARVPPIDLVLTSQGVVYDIHGHTSTVEVKKNVLCLAFVNGGKKAKNAIVLGGRQLEDKILEFDLSTTVLRFSPSLLLHNASCSDPASLKF